jgi:hypothetical protein
MTLLALSVGGEKNEDKIAGGKVQRRQMLRRESEQKKKVGLAGELTSIDYLLIIDPLSVPGNALCVFINNHPIHYHNLLW